MVRSLGFGFYLTNAPLKLAFATPTYINLSLLNIYLANPLYKRYDDFRLLVYNQFSVLFHYYLFQLSLTVLIYYRYVILFTLRCVVTSLQIILLLISSLSINGPVTLFGFNYPAWPKSDHSIRFRSPLLTKSRLISPPPGTKMFQFPRLRGIL